MGVILLLELKWSCVRTAAYDSAQVHLAGSESPCACSAASSGCPSVASSPRCIGLASAVCSASPSSASHSGARRSRWHRSRSRRSGQPCGNRQTLHHPMTSGVTSSKATTTGSGIITPFADWERRLIICHLLLRHTQENRGAPAADLPKKEGHGVGAARR